MKTPLIFGICLLMAGCSAKEESSPTPVVNVKAVRAEVADVLISVGASATIYPRQEANIAARLTAPIRQLHVRKGDNVRAGQVLAEQEDRDLAAQRSEAAAAVIDAEASLQKTTAGTLPADVERARGEVANAEASLNQAQKMYDRRRELFAQGAIPNRDLLTSETELSHAKTSYEVAKKSLDLLLNQSRDQDIRIAQSRFDQAKARLSLLDAQLQFAKIQCPFDGTIVEQFMYAGDMAKPDAPIFAVMDLSVAIARAQIPEGQSGAVRIGQACSFTPADSPTSTFEGKLSVVNRAVDPARRTIEVWCEISRSGSALRAGAFGNATIITGTAPKSIMVPLPAVQFQEGTRSGFVMVIDDKHAARKREVETGEIANNMVQITKGINPGELVIVEGGYGLPDGTEVRLAEEKK
ncbi:MAG: efflux RND transporter periplasmic adaptor subunit [Acidobacteriia bacterium]|nr:efflux RND transporter periplasmic adaptor subunit [Terriglobia bacterium]